MIVIFGRPNCPDCVTAKSLCESQGIDFDYVEIGTDITREELMELIPPGTRKLPIIFEDEIFIGSLAELQKLLVS